MSPRGCPLAPPQLLVFSGGFWHLANWLSAEKGWPQRGRTLWLPSLLVPTPTRALSGVVFAEEELLEKPQLGEAATEFVSSTLSPSCLIVFFRGGGVWVKIPSCFFRCWWEGQSPSDSVPTAPGQFWVSPVPSTGDGICRAGIRADSKVMLLGTSSDFFFLIMSKMWNV